METPQAVMNAALLSPGSRGHVACQCLTCVQEAACWAGRAAHPILAAAAPQAFAADAASVVGGAGRNKAKVAGRANCAACPVLASHTLEVFSAPLAPAKRDRSRSGCCGMTLHATYPTAHSPWGWWGAKQGKGLLPGLKKQQPPPALSPTDLHFK